MQEVSTKLMHLSAAPFCSGISLELVEIAVVPIHEQHCVILLLQPVIKGFLAEMAAIPESHSEISRNNDDVTGRKRRMDLVEPAVLIAMGITGHINHIVSS